ncbi:DgyrCDS14640 [Dimorphilus gyrociliatus]|uniref:DgyrCDS14640 n=1 Tax=Dimorphilus gyrociliatus TaxID=2664684 RepID=A0A7I8WED0_9ANNE|nr:DgyrCDS14640 [Dimorphilus gyrociliatus]
MDYKIFFFFTLNLITTDSATVTKKQILNCQVGQTTDKILSCGICQSGTIHSIDRLSCYKCPDYCAIGSCKLKADTSNPADATICEKCINNYFMKEGSCQKCLPGCKKCDSIDKCQDCFSNFALRSKSQDCIACPQNCKKCSWLVTTLNVLCEICNEGYTVQNRNCVACGSYCKSCKYTKGIGITCNTCDTNAYKETNNNKSTCKLCSTSMAGCAKCSNKDTCTECISKAYVLTSSKSCTKCSSIHSSCLECKASSGTNKCTKCKIGYYIKDNSCFSCPRNCHTCLETNNVVKCSRCMADYTVLASNACDKCPDNCLECEVSSSKLICKADKCKPKYTRNSHNLCSRCPDKCNECTWNAANSRTECTGTNAIHSCIEKETGRSWGRKSDGTCAACPNNCDKCYFEKNTAITPVCYASMCQNKYTFDDISGICVSCPDGCEHCKKRPTGLTCIECSKGFAPNYGNSSNNIEFCVACSIENCDFCEVISNEVKCMRSPCENFASKKFSFETGTCEDIPINSVSFSTDTDESEFFSLERTNGTSFDHDTASEYIEAHPDEVFAWRFPPPPPPPSPCPPGSIFIPFGPFSGQCRDCGYNCADCFWPFEEIDVKCRTCIGNTQWVDIEVEGVASRGCYDCTNARLQCNKFERFGSHPNYKCRCKVNECMGDQTVSGKVTALQESNSASTPFQKCSACSEMFPYAFECSGSTNGYPKVSSCQIGFAKSKEDDFCLKIDDFCTVWNVTDTVNCLDCAVGSFKSELGCEPCPPGCSECFLLDSEPFCIACSNGKSGRDCKSSPDICDVKTVDFCEQKLNVVEQNFIVAICSCVACNSNYKIENALYKSGQRVGSCTVRDDIIGPLPNCLMHSSTPEGIGCSRCNQSATLINHRCVGIDNCKPGFNGKYMDKVQCNVPAKNYIKNDTEMIYVPSSLQGGLYCKGYISKSQTFSVNAARCAGCEPGYVLDTSNENQYTCISCQLSNLPNCVFAIAFNSKCICGRCYTDTADKHFLKHPVDSGCIEIADIPDCNEYTLKLTEGVYVSVCNECSNDKIVSKDGQTCLPCGPCHNGIPKLNLTRDACECTCLNNSFLNTNSNGCVNCSLDQIPNCKVFGLINDACTCSECLPTYELIGNSQCINCQNDIICTGGTAVKNSGNMCVCTCSSNALLNSNSNGCVSCSSDQIPNCKVFGLINDACTCSECLPTYELIGNSQCINCQNDIICTGGTVVKNSGNMCECTCSSNALLNSNSNGCVNCSSDQIPNCKVFGLINDACTCSECLPTYELIGNSQCINCQNDIICTGGTAVKNSGNTCVCTCSSNALLNSNSNGCVSCSSDQIPNCKVFRLINDACTCSECLVNYQLHGKTQCINNTNGEGGAGVIANCKEYNSPAVSECIECISGWALEPASPLTISKCHQCQAGCKSCIVDVTSTPTTVNKCTECLSSYALNNAGTCIQCPYNCDECRADPENQNNAICLSLGCRLGALKDSDFSCNSCSIANCEVCVQQINGIFKCLKCHRGYYKDNNGNCVACIANCPVCLNDQYCISDGCKEGFIRHRTEGTCLPCTGDGVARCSYQTASSNILIPQICKIGFRLNKSTNLAFCERCDPNCKKCNVNGIAKCDDEQCNLGYFYDPISKECFQNKPRCEKSERLCPTGCNSCSLVGESVQCTSCLPSYGLSQGSCKQCNVDKCQTCEIPSGKSSMVCTQCSEQHYLNADSCGKCPHLCKECSHNGNYQCKTCLKGYGKASDGTCIHCPSNCEICAVNSNRIGICIKCASNEFSLQTDGTCMPCSSAVFANCATCSSTTLNRKAVCNSCTAGYSLSDDGEECIPCSITKCSMCIHGNICSECKTGFHLMNYNKECAQKCYECKGNQAECGDEISSSNNNTDKMRIVNCSIGDCWAYRSESFSKLEYARGCSNETCTSETEHEYCKSADGKIECVKCCKGDKCNSWELDGKAGVEKTTYKLPLIAISVIYVFFFQSKPFN